MLELRRFESGGSGGICDHELIQYAVDFALPGQGDKFWSLSLKVLSFEMRSHGKWQAKSNRERVPEPKFSHDDTASKVSRLSSQLFCLKNAF